MDCVEAEVMERASAKMANWYRMVQARVWDRNRNRGIIRILYLRTRWNRVSACERSEGVGIESQELICSDNCKLENEISKRQKKDSLHSQRALGAEPALVQGKSALPCLWGLSRYPIETPAELRPGPY